jgi:hypothetical protein
VPSVVHLSQTCLVYVIDTKRRLREAVLLSNVHAVDQQKRLTKPSKLKGHYSAGSSPVGSGVKSWAAHPPALVACHFDLHVCLLLESVLCIQRVYCGPDGARDVPETTRSLPSKINQVLLGPSVRGWMWHVPHVGPRGGAR